MLLFGERRDQLPSERTIFRRIRFTTNFDDLHKALCIGDMNFVHVSRINIYMSAKGTSSAGHYTAFDNGFEVALKDAPFGLIPLFFDRKYP